MRDHIWTAALAVGFALTLSWLLATPHRTLLNWDEVSYVRAARLGLHANAWDQGALSPGALLAFISAKRQHRTPDLPRGYDEERDPLLLRNLHPPLVVFFVIPFSRSSAESVLRLGQTLGAWTLLLMLLMAHRWTSTHPTRIGSVAVGALGVWAGRLLFAYVQCHGWMTIWTLASAVALARWLRGRERTWGAASAVFLALSVVTLHTGLVVVAAALVAVLVLGRLDGGLRVQRNELAVGASIVVTTVLLLWPGSVAKLSLLRIFAQYAYLINIGKEWAGSRALLGENLLALLPMVVLLPALCWWLWTRQRSEMARWGPALVIAALYAIPVLPHLLTATYLLPALGMLIPLVGWQVDCQPGRWRAWAAGGIASVLAALSLWATPSPVPEDIARRQDLAWLKSTLRDRETLADGAHVLMHYLGASYRINPLAVTYEGDDLLLREKGRYRPLTPRDTSGRVVLVLARRPNFPDSARRIPSLVGCPPATGRTVFLFDCTAVRKDSEMSGGARPVH